MEPDLKTDLLVSTAAAAVAGWSGSSAATAIITIWQALRRPLHLCSCPCFCLCMAGLSLVAACYRKRVKKLENRRD